jgi:hypothetical protein
LATLMTLLMKGMSFAHPLLQYNDLTNCQIFCSDRFRLNYGSTEGHENACPGHFICFISK